MCVWALAEAGIRNPARLAHGEGPSRAFWEGVSCLNPGDRCFEHGRMAPGRLRGRSRCATMADGVAGGNEKRGQPIMGRPL